MPGSVTPLHTRALLTKLKLEFGLMRPARAVEWARKLAVELGDPPYFLAEMAREKDPRAAVLVEILDDALRDRDDVPALRLLLGGLCAPLQKNPGLVKKFAVVLDKVSRTHAGQLPEDMQGMHLFQGRLGRIADGEPLAGDVPLRVAADMMEFLKRFIPKPG